MLSWLPERGHVAVSSILRGCVARTRSEAGTLLRHVALEVGEDGREFGFVADGGQNGIEVAKVAPPRPQPASAASRSASGDGLFSGLCALSPVPGRASVRSARAAPRSPCFSTSRIRKARTARSLRALLASRSLEADVSLVVELEVDDVVLEVDNAFRPREAPCAAHDRVMAATVDVRS